MRRWPLGLAVILAGPLLLLIAWLVFRPARASLESAAAKLAAADEFSGVILIARDGAEPVEQAYGLADRERRISNNAGTRFNIGQLAWMFTSVAVAQLVEEGKLAFTDTVGQRLPAYPWLAGSRSITIHHLLTHTSGLPPYAPPGGTESIAREKLLSAPGGTWQPSESGYMLLAAIVEAVAGAPYFDHIRRRVFEPAGMASTGALTPDASSSGIAIGYVIMAGSKSVPRQPNTLTLGKSAVYSTAGDLLRFTNALQKGLLVSTHSLELLLNGQVRLRRAPYEMYSYGFGVTKRAVWRVIGTQASFPGGRCWLEFIPEQRHTAILLANDDGGGAQALFRVSRAAR